MSHATSLETLRPESVTVRDRVATIDGVQVDVDVVYEQPDPSVGWPGGWELGECGTPRLVERAEWDAAHPGVEPTAEAMSWLIAKAEDEIVEQASEGARERAADERAERMASERTFFGRE